jgi:hypothetical protein
MDHTKPKNMESFKKTPLFEKLIFLDLTNLQFGQLPNSEYLDSYCLLTEHEKTELGILAGKIHDYFNLINCDIILNVHEIEINSVQECQEMFGNVDPDILRIANDFGLTLKQGQMTQCNLHI